jgi:hypothetical protein
VINAADLLEELIEASAEQVLSSPSYLEAGWLSQARIQAWDKEWLIEVRRVR